MIPSSLKLKRGQEFIYKGDIVTIYHHKTINEVVIDYPGTDRSEVVNRNDLIAVKNYGSAIKSKPLTTEKKADIRDKNVFFASQILTMPDRCENCNKPLKVFNKPLKRCVTAHILPKAIFESVKTNPLNIMFLGAGIIGICFCHDKWDNGDAADRMKMKVYEKALQRFELFKDKLTSKEYNQALTYLGITKK